MITGLKIEGHKNISEHNKLLIYNKPQYVYVPLIISNDTSLTVTVKKGDYVFKGQVVAHKKGEINLPLHSPVSGTIIDYEDKTIYNGNKVKCLKIENDLEEKLQENEQELDKIDKYTKDNFIKLLKDGGIRGLGGADFPTYIKYQAKNIKNIIINAVECEPYITADYATIKEHYEEIVETIDAIMTINKIENGYIAVKKTNKEVIDLLNTVIGTYPHIKLVKVPNLYPMGWERNLIKYVLKVEYNKIPSEVNTVVNNVGTIYAIYTLLKYHRPLTERIVTITGEMVKKPTNVLVKVGTDIKEVISKLGIKKGEYVFVAGGPMMGTNIPSKELVVTCNLNCILILNPIENKETNCLRCGKCANHCPAHLSPVLIKDCVNDLEDLKPSLCIECGLCSYICPAQIDVREYVRKAKERVKK